MTTRPDNEQHSGTSPGISTGADQAATAELALRHAIRTLPSPADTTRVQALQARVLAQWRDAVPEAGRAAQGAMAGAGISVGLGAAGATPAGSNPGGRSGLPRLLWLGAAAVAIAAAVGLKMWHKPSDPVMDELMKIDVLSQMAAGEM